MSEAKHYTPQTIYDLAAGTGACLTELAEQLKAASVKPHLYELPRGITLKRYATGGGSMYVGQYGERTDLTDNRRLYTIKVTHQPENIWSATILGDDKLIAIISGPSRSKIEYMAIKALKGYLNHAIKHCRRSAAQRKRRKAEKRNPDNNAEK